MRSTFFFIAFFFCGMYLQAQVQVRLSNTTNFNPKDLIKNIFLGQGVEVLDVKFEGQNKSTGYFSNGQNAISIDRGIIMTTGDATHASLPNSNTINSSTSSGTSLKDVELSNAIGSNDLNDIARFEITFIPFYDTISFRYVFASEEYPSYSCDKYNDVFGFFISGQNPLGGQYNNKNIALIPGTNEVVSINNVHPAYLENCAPKNVEFYNENPLGSQTMVYNGYLDVFSASAKVVPCTVYKIKIAIADVVDNLYDSSVFLEAKSFSASGMNVTVETPSFDDIISEGCQPAKITFSFAGPLKEDYSLNLRLLNDPSLGSLATPDSDFNSIPTNGIITKTNSTFSFIINAYEDYIAENDEIIAFEYQKDLCNVDTILITISDNKLANIELTDTIDMCQDMTVNVGAKLPENYNPGHEKYFKSNKEYVISGSKGSSVNSKITINNISPGTLKLEMLKEICIDTLFGRNLYDLDIYLVSPDNRFLELSTDNGFRPGGNTTVDSMLNTCFTVNATKNINNGNSVLGNYFPLNPEYSGYFAPEGVWKDIDGVKLNGDWQLFIYKDEEGWTNTLKSWHITFNSKYDLFYNWNPVTEISCSDCLSPDIFPSKSDFYYINLKDTYGCEAKDSVFANVNSIETVSYIECDSVSTDFIRFSWSSPDINDNYELNINNSGTWIPYNARFYDFTGLSFSEKFVLEVKVADPACSNPSISKQCETFPCPPPEVKIISRKDVDCFGDKNGEIILEAFGTVAPYSFKFKGIDLPVGTFSGLGAGEDTIFIMDGLGCEIPFIFEILSPLPISVNTTKSDISCFGLNDGEIITQVFGGNGSYSFEWFDPINNSLQASQNLNDLNKGIYYLTIKDSKNCVYVDSVVIDEPSKLTLVDSVVNIECKGHNSGMIYINCTGGIQPYTYEWDTPVGSSDSKDLVNVPAGNYMLTITDKNDCKLIESFFIAEPSKGLEINFSGIDTLCHGNKNGNISLNIPNIDEYEVRWNGGYSGTDLKDIGKGIYSVTITDKTGCTYTKDIEVVELEPVVIDLLQQAATCHDFSDGIAWVDKVFYGARETNKSKFSFSWDTPDAQTGQYAYYLKGGDIYTITGINEFQCISKASIVISNPPPLITRIKSRKEVSCSGGSDAFIDMEVVGCPSCHFKWGENAKTGDTSLAMNLSSGIYKLTVVNENGCFSENTYTIVEPPPLDISLKIDDVKCYDGADGSAKINITGGSPPYFAMWNDTLRKFSIDNLQTGYHKVVVTDLNNCTEALTFFIDQPDTPVSGIAESIDVTCFNGYDGEIHFVPDGGSPPYSFRINGDSFYGTNSIIGLKSGIYSGTIKDINGCIFTVEDIKIFNPLPIIVDLGNDTIIDYGTSISIIPVIINHNDPVYYQWIVPESVDISCTYCPDPTVVIKFNTVIKLVVTDTKGCSAEGLRNIKVKLNKDIYIPTAFNPDSFHEENSRVFVYGKSGIKIISFIIFDGWGGEVYKRENFDINDETTGWDGTFKGTKLNSGSFPWMLEILHPDGTTEIFKGVVTLLN